ncbi:elongation of very long chain fatty acids protein 7-like isoform X2 [Pomacea canaliculata]|nr:elongation of very long chain fatty acids protein 7-like isoform X2 [Pomacea canaliculata]XP_025085037.1 elongation of very long chain fatty acids protein 7-like isoform X2 [Pomacea canaliculata]XP_025085038.1 elongation of very long chain fatty acids protein 7-like isoform X2 [Pomacea canaliculata]
MKSFEEHYHDLITKNADPRTKDWLLVGSPWPIACLCILYLVMVRVGQQMMIKRPAFSLQGPMIAYNLFLVLLSAYMLYEFIMSSWLVPGFNFHCAPVDASDNPSSLRLARAVWWYYFSKVIEFADTAFFVLRKKNNQVTILHLYHHVTMPFLWYIGTTFAPGGEAYFAASVNCLVHIIMYSYYLLSALGPAVQPYLWWKKYLTGLQLLQFTIVMVRAGYAVYTNCSYPLIFQKMLIFYMLSFIVLFSNFFYQTYFQKKHRSAAVNGVSNGVFHDVKHIRSLDASQCKKD